MIYVCYFLISWGRVEDGASCEERAMDERGLTKDSLRPRHLHMTIRQSQRPLFPDIYLFIRLAFVYPLIFTTPTRTNPVQTTCALNTFTLIFLVPNLEHRNCETLCSACDRSQHTREGRPQSEMGNGKNWKLSLISGRSCL